MLEYWKRNEKYKAMEWGMDDFEETEVDRPGQGLVLAVYRICRDCTSTFFFWRRDLFLYIVRMAFYL